VVTQNQDLLQNNTYRKYEPLLVLYAKTAQQGNYMFYKNSLKRTTSVL